MQFTASYYLAKALFNIDSEKALNAFGWCALAAVKALRDEGHEKKKSYNDLIVSIVTELSSLKIDGTSEYDVILSNQIRHYMTECLAAEDKLKQYRKEPRECLLAFKLDGANANAQMEATWAFCRKRRERDAAVRRCGEGAVFRCAIQLLRLDEETIPSERCAGQWRERRLRA